MISPSAASAAHGAYHNFSFLVIQI